ncbi:hypothetical protein SHI21_19880 [Bacteriovorax sp. PP10]|uniref:Uncharacterized protein n=1 Tax=Bacteriovorax antarcticus TaxID=3088717 RepID=A0ABU5VZN1_9BACT|nr:hypothetical protein [Bacteriovorax sp. PP10]MEA9358506.1 hypothetical protein [Bacteriovorax sp. PP10]
MLKTMLFLTFIFSSNAFSSIAPLPDFEAELRALETSQFKTEELQMANADAVTDVISDEVATGQASVVRPQEKPTTTLEKIDWSVDNSIPEPTPTVKTRRIRSR